MSHDYGIPEECKRFTVLYEFRTRPLHRKGKLTQESACFVAHDVAEALRLAKEYGERNYRRRTWRIISFQAGE